MFLLYSSPLLLLCCADLLALDCFDLASKTAYAVETYWLVELGFDLMYPWLCISFAFFLEGEWVAFKCFLIIPEGFACLQAGQQGWYIWAHWFQLISVGLDVPTSVPDLVIEFPFSHYETLHSPSLYMSSCILQHRVTVRGAWFCVIIAW